MAVTLADILKASASPMVKGLLMDLLRASDVLSTVILIGVDGLQITDKRWQTLPGAGFRTVNGGYVESSGTTEDVQETLALIGGDVKIDRVADKVKPAVEKPIVTQMKMKSKAVAFTYNDAFINGDQGVNPDSYEGLKKRVANMPSRQTISLSPGAGDSLKVLASTANIQTFLEALHAAIKYVDGANRIYMNENTIIKFGTALRTIGLPYDTLQLFEKTFNGFAGIPFIDVGLKGDKTTEIITNTEDPGDAGNDATSIYVTRMDDVDGLCGIQLNGMPLDVYDPLKGAELSTGPQYLRRIDWATGLRNPSQYCICRIKDFKMATA